MNSIYRTSWVCYGQAGGPLSTIQINNEPFTPPSKVHGEDLARDRIMSLLDSRMKHTLRHTFERLIINSQLDDFGLGGLTVVEYDAGGAATTFRGKTDKVLYDPIVQWTRLPGDVKPSIKWRTDMRDGPRDWQFRQVLSQLNSYMNEFETQCGFIITDQELLLVRRRDTRGGLDLAPPISWTTRGSAATPRMTVLMALWYLAMLAADDGDWCLPGKAMSELNYLSLYL